MTDSFTSLHKEFADLQSLSLDVPKDHTNLVDNDHDRKDVFKLQALPTELLQDILYRLRLSSLMSLKLVCRRTYEVTVRFILAEKGLDAILNRTKLSEGELIHATSNSHRRFKDWVNMAGYDERIKYLCMLARDHKIPKSKLICGACACFHDKTSFKKEENLNQRTATRRCSISLEKISVCRCMPPEYHENKRNRVDYTGTWLMECYFQGLIIIWVQFPVRNAQRSSLLFPDLCHNQMNDR